MSKETIIVDGAGASVTLNAVAIADINTIAFTLFGEREEINLTTIDATKFKQKLLADLQKISDVVINKKSDPQTDMLLYSTALQDLVISYQIGKLVAPKTVTFSGAQVKSISQSTLERAPGDGINVDITIHIGNMDGAAMTETAPVIA